jgi:hypothetical protein
VASPVARFCILCFLIFNGNGLTLNLGTGLMRIPMNVPKMDL